MPAAGVYPVINDFSSDPKSGEISVSPYWIIAIVRVGTPLSFSRAKMASVSDDLAKAALLRNDRPLIITDDCIQLQVQNSKASHTKNFSAQLIQADTNYLVEILPGDWCMAWIVNNRQDYLSLLNRLSNSLLPCNEFLDGFKFLGRVNSVRKNLQVQRGTGTKHAVYQLQATGFHELDTMFFYDHAMATGDFVKKDIGTWLARIGLEVESLFKVSVERGIQENNVNDVIPTLLDTIVGKGVSKTANASVRAANGQLVGQIVGAGASKEAPNAYLIPTVVGSLLGKTGTSKGQYLSYADILELIQGVQHYPNKGPTKELFVPERDDGSSTPSRHVTKTKMLGTFLPLMPEFTNRPLWQVFQQFLNPTINEIYTCLRVNHLGSVVPTMVLRQIPFTTEAFQPRSDRASDLLALVLPVAIQVPLPHTKFLELPRWGLDTSLVYSVDIGRSDATHVNFIHVYGTAAYSDHNVAITAQIINNPPVRDDLDIQRSGLRSYMTTVDCAVEDQVYAPGVWMALVADWMMGSQFTLNGTIECVGIQAPICEGDNIEWDGVVYHIESVTHACMLSGNSKSFTTTLTLTNGMRASGTVDSNDPNVVGFPIYPGMAANDNVAYDPGVSVDHEDHPRSSAAPPAAPPSDETIVRKVKTRS